MHVGSDNAVHLTYCTNIHPGEGWADVAESLKEYLPPLKARLAPTSPFGVGLRLSNRAAEELLDDDRLQSFGEWLDEQGLYVFTINGFPYGRFHGDRIKDDVYAPDWRTQDRVDYTQRLARILARLVPDGVVGSISTSPLSYKRWFQDEASREEAFRTSARHLAEVAHTLAHLEDERGTHVHVDLEPEPDCLIENTEETVRFFEDWLWPVGGAYLADTLGASETTARRLLQRHLQVCYDTCHFALQYETPSHTLARFEEAGISVGKIQLSSALRVPMSGNRQTIANRLRPFAESTYLHQVVERRTDGPLGRYPDLPDALPHIDQTDAEEWRIHYHVPLFTAEYDGLASTRTAITDTITALKENVFCTHLEIETYTWDVLPSRMKKPLATSLRREYEWTLSNWR